MRGFTLIEILIYVAILAGVLVSATAFGFRILEDRAKTAVDREVQQNARFALETINRAVRSASGINEPLEGATSTTLGLATADASADPTVFSLNGETIEMSEGGGSAVPLTSDQIRVTSILFTNTSYSGTPGNIKIDLSLEYRNPSGRKEYDKRISIAASSQSLREGPPSYKVFVSSATYRGDLGGLSGADSNCQNLAAATGFGSVTWKAWLSDQATHARDRLVHPTSFIVRIDGVEIAADWDDLVDGALLAPISIDENGSVVSDFAWTGSTGEGTWVSSGTNNACRNWTRRGGSDRERSGRSQETTEAWTNQTVNGCGTFQRLYCFSQEPL